MIHVLAEQATLGGDFEAPGYQPGFSPIPASRLRDLATTTKTKPVAKPSANPEPGYRLSAALAKFVRIRDLTCRFPWCDRPAEVCDIDHTIPYDAGGLTHPSNLKCVCRK